MDKKNISFALQSEEEGIIAGYASVFNVVDQHNDLIKPGSFKQLNKQKIKLLWQHKTDEPIGIIEEIKEDNYGLYFKAKLLLAVPQAKAAYQLVKSKAISGVSIGFKTKIFQYQQDIRVIEEIDLWEISLVTFPANIEANLTEVKQYSRGNNMPQKQQQQYAWEQYKSVNEQRLNEIEQRGSADPLLNQQLITISDYLDEYKSRLELLETSISRPNGEQFISHKDNEHKTAFNSYLRSGQDQQLSRIEQKSLSTMSEADGGYLITRSTSKQITKILEEISPMRQLASREQISSSSLDIIEDCDKAGAGWTSETKEVLDTDTPRISKRNINVFELYAQPTATQKLIDDSSIDIEKWLAEKLIHSFAKLENHSFIHGDGTSQPRGILTYENGADWGKIQQINSGSESGLDSDSLINLYFSMKEQYCRNASFLMHRSSLQAIRMLKDKSTGRYLWNPSLDSSTPDTLLGVALYEAADMPIIAKGSLSIAIADFKAAYKIVDRTGVRVLRDPYTFKPFVKFYTTKRVGGDVINFEAIKLLKTGV